MPRTSAKRVFALNVNLKQEKTSMAGTKPGHDESRVSVLFGLLHRNHARGKLLIKGLNVS